MSTATPPNHGAERDADFIVERDRLWGVAYRICGTRSDADDVLQDAWFRWARTSRDTIERPAAWLTTVVGRLAIDRLRDRQRRTTDYVGPWLPEMIETPVEPDHSDLVDSLTVGFLAMLERLDPVERVVFLLADVFGESFADIAETVDRNEAACRQIASRARSRVRDANRHRPVSATDQWRLAAAFGHAVGAGDLAAVRALLASDAVLVSDGGAHTRAARYPVVGPDRIARFMVNLNRRGVEAFDTTFEPASVNHEPGMLMFLGGELFITMVVHCEEVDDGTPRIANVFMMRNPEKLEALR